MKRIIMHWTAGGNTVSHIDRKHYHFIVDGSGKVHAGDKNPEANESTRDGHYAAHTRMLNTGSIGVAVAAMAGAKERPFWAGSYPITDAQVKALADLCADLAEIYNIPIDGRSILTHAEVQPTLGVMQRGKWDITWLPGMDKPSDPIEVGDRLRAMIRDAGKDDTPKPTTNHAAAIEKLEQALAILKA